MLQPQDPEVLWILIVGFIIAFFLAFGVGANDVANSFGTSVGSKVLTLRQACILATIFEVLGSVMLGYKVSDTVRKGIFDVDMYSDYEKELMLGNMAALAGSAVWNIVATFFRWPVSGTHSIVGAVVGFTLVSRGIYSVKWIELGKIVASWFLSPVLSGLASTAIFVVIRRFILSKDHPLEPALMSLPFFYGFTVFINIFSVVYDGPEALKFDRIPWWGSLILATGTALIVAVVVWCVVIPRQRRTINEMLSEASHQDVVNPAFTVEEKPIPMISLPDNNSVHNAGDIGSPNQLPLYHTSMNEKNESTPVNESPLQNGVTISMHQTLHHSASKQPLVENDKLGYESIPKPEAPSQESEGDQQSPPPKDEEVDKPETAKVFSFLQILTAIFASFAHGANDVSNAIGPLIALWLIYMDGRVEQNSMTPFYLLLYGGFGISVGLWIWGKKVIQTLGEDLTKITPSSGFTIEVGAATTVLVASKLGLPISTTHCKVGSVVFVGWTRSRTSVDWSLFRNIVLAWLLTLPVSGGLSAALMAIFRAVAL